MNSETFIVVFLGYCMNATGIYHIQDKICAFHEEPIPQTKQLLQAFLGLLNFCHAILPQKLPHLIEKDIW